VARVYGLRFSGLAAELIAVDSLYVRTPKSADATLLAPGGRVDVDVVAPVEPGTYEIFDDWGGSKKLLGTIVVQGDVVETPDFVTPSNPGVPTWDVATDIGVDIEYKFVFRGGQWTINGKAYPDPDVQNIELDRFTRIRFNNSSDRIHPMYLHGQSFKLIEKNGEPIDEGFFRDSVLLFPNDVIDVGLVAIDAGTWVLQCHIMEHTAAGMVSLVEITPS
jgi:FtsP/CotA-like multicopper oxidase with cupredoxin domain